MAKNRLQRLISPSATAVPTTAPGSRSQMDARERRYRAEDALRTLTRAAEIQCDRTLMRDVKVVAKEQMKTLQKVAKPSGR